jgi:molybdenum cofactor biosynthesis enzyme
MARLTHLDAEGHARMVDVGGKAKPGARPSPRAASA